MTLLDRDSIEILPWCVTLDIACQVLPRLDVFRDDEGRIDFKDQKALALYNKAVAKTIAGLDIEVPPGYLIPAVCLRHSYLICLVEELIEREGRILEIGTGASAILAMLAARLYSHQVVATEIDATSYRSAMENIKWNGLEDKITLLKSEGQIISDLTEGHGPFDVVICYPPTYPEHERQRFDEGVAIGFRGTSSEMVGGGIDGFDFINQYLSEAITAEQIRLISIMLIFESHLVPSCKLLEMNGFKVNVTELRAGSRSRYLVVAYRS